MIMMPINYYVSNTQTVCRIKRKLTQLQSQLLLLLLLLLL